jgi:hypothetical protein
MDLPHDGFVAHSVQNIRVVQINSEIGPSFPENAVDRFDRNATNVENDCSQIGPEREMLPASSSGSEARWSRTRN